MADFIGDDGANFFTGGNDPDTAAGNGGNDQLNGNGGNDILAGNTGADTLNGGDGEDTLFTADRDPLFGYPYGLIGETGPGIDTGSVADTVNGGADTDYIFAGWNDNVDGGSGNDFLYLSLLAATGGVSLDFNQATQTNGSGTIQSMEAVGWIQGSNHNDSITLGPQVNYAPFTYVYAMGGNDNVTAGYTTYEIYGGDGDDTLDARPSQYLGALDGGAGNDILYTRRYSHNTFGGSGNDTIHGGGFIFGGAGDDDIFLLDGYDAGGVYGEEGNDEIHAGPRIGGYMISGGVGGDTLIGDLGHDTLVSYDFAPAGYYIPLDDPDLAVDVLSGGDGNDTLVIGYGDSADGGDGNDTLRLSLAGRATGMTLDTAGLGSGLTVALGGGTIQNIEYFEYLRGTNFADTFTIATQTSLLTIDAGAGNDTITSNNSSISLSGGDGNDLLISGAAGDSFDGGAGSDTIDYRNAAAGVTVNAGATATWIGPGGDQVTGVERVVGSTFADTMAAAGDVLELLGGGGNDSLSTGSANNLLDGGTGNDAMAGGGGNDTYRVDSAADVVIEAVGGGSDTVIATVGYTLGAGQHIEMLRTSGSSTTYAVNFTGNELAQTLAGNAAANVLDGRAGADTMWGYAGDDTFYVRDGGDGVIEAAGCGNDTVIAYTSHALGAGQEVELLRTPGSTSTSTINLTGNELANTLLGNAGVNSLNGGGGADYLRGYAGNDTYYVDNAADAVIEAAGGGNDTVTTSVSFVLGAGQEVETLRTYGSGTTDPVKLTGNELANTLLGNAANNVLDGKGAADTMRGYGGDDIYRVDNIGDVVVEVSNGGGDAVIATVSYKLGAGQHIEALKTTGSSSTYVVNFTGNELANSLAGNAAANVLDGKGGNDTLWGYGGADTFRFTTAPGTDNVDTIFGFVAADDTIQIDDAVFAGLALGALAAGAFRTGSAAADADDRIIYNNATGQLLFDVDGVGGAAAVQFAVLSSAPAIAANDFLVI